MSLTPEKLAKLQEQARSGSAGGMRRKVIKKPAKAAPGAESAKVTAALKKVGTTPVEGIEEANFFCADGNVVHFDAPRVYGQVSANTFVISGSSKTVELTELAPGILSQLGPSALANLHEMARQYQARAAAAGMSLEELAKIAAQAKDAPEDEIPDLVKNFEAAEIDAN